MTHLAVSALNRTSLLWNTRSQDAWHRGTAPLPGKLRVNHHVIWRRAAAEWISWQSYPTPMSSMPHRFLVGLSPMQRGLLGFPLPGDAYWTEDTITAVGKRYAAKVPGEQGMDMRPYERAFSARL